MQTSQQHLTDSSWEYIKKIVDNGRKRKTCLRMVVDGGRAMPFFGSPAQAASGEI